MRNPRFDDDFFDTWERPDIQKCCCKDCSLRAADRKMGEEIVVYGATLAICAVFDGKPHEILWSGESCPYYVKDDK